jgi:hypothetical protein
MDSTGKVTFEYAEKHFGDHAPLEEVLEAVRAFAPEEFKSKFNPVQAVSERKASGGLRFAKACTSDVCAL